MHGLLHYPHPPPRGTFGTVAEPAWMWSAPRVCCRCRTHAVGVDKYVMTRIHPYTRTSERWHLVYNKALVLQGGHWLVVWGWNILSRPGRISCSLALWDKGHFATTEAGMGRVGFLNSSHPLSVYVSSR